MAPALMPSNSSLKKRTSNELVSGALAGADFIAQQQLDDGRIPWFRGQITDPWDHVEAAMGLTVAGHNDAAKRAYQWLAKAQNTDGSWYSEYGQRAETYHDLPDAKLKQSHHGIYLATGLWHYHLATADLALIKQLWPTLEQAAAFVLQLQTEHGDILWGKDGDNQLLDDSLITACSAIYKSLGCALNLCDKLTLQRPYWVQAYRRLGEALRHKPERFDRSWASKKRYAMDWFYPFLSGVVAGQAGRDQLLQRWQEFVVPELGCLCVNDHPWVTVAETAELCLALTSLGLSEQAEQLLQQLLQFQDDSDGGFWTGYVHTDEALWPEEKTTWTAAAVLLATDSLLHLTPAGRLFMNHRAE